LISLAVNFSTPTGRDVEEPLLHQHIMHNL
jgi:hypothetical protein